MIKTLFLLVFSVIFIEQSYGFNRNFSAEVSQTVKEVLAKWENKELEVSVGCAQQLYQLLENLVTLDDGFWAYKMIDATGKFPSGLAEGNFVLMGSFDECVHVKSNMKNITGNYCSITIDVSSMDLSTLSQTQQQIDLLTSYKKLTHNAMDLFSGTIGSLPLYGLCIPNKCSTNDLKNALQVVTSIIPLGITCQTKDEVIPPLDAGAIVTIVFLGMVIILMICSTVFDYICQRKGVKAHPILISFSTYTNGQKLFRMRSSQGELGCLNGIRFLSMCWVILGHVFFINLFGPHVNLFVMLGFLGKTEVMFYLGIAHAVDTFFVLSGLLVAYNFMKKMKKGEKFNIFKYYMHRYLRLTPAYAVVILCSIYLLKYLGAGPLYFTVDSFAGKVCRDHWWKALLYLQNYIANTANLCVSQTWNLSVDYQLYLISPALLFFLYKSPRFGTIMTLIAIIGCMVAGFVITHKNHLGVFIVNRDTSTFFKEYYDKTHTRAPTWLIGAWLGYVLGRINFYNDRRYLKIPRLLVMFIWLIVLAVIPVCVFGFHDVLKINADYDVMANSLYNTFVRPIWALCISWIIFACTVGYGGIINKFLSLSIFGVLSKFTYCMYLLHLTILYMMISSRKIPAYFSVPGMMNQFCSLFAVTFVLSIFWILAFEMPMLVIEPYIFQKWETSPKKNQQVNSGVTSNSKTIETEA